MKFDVAAKALEGIPYTSPAKGRVFYDLVMQNRPKRILELGFAHGVSTCYFGAAAHELGDCSVTAVDLELSSRFKPSLEDLLSKLDLAHLVSVQREVSSYTWFLKKEIARRTTNHACQGYYDLIFVDGPKDWTNDGCTFFLADKLLTPGGLILFDDYEWSYRGDEATRGKQHKEGYIFKQMSEEEFAEPHVKAIFQLLVMQHPNYSDFEIVDNQLALARKVSTGAVRELTFNTRFSLKYRAISALRKWAKQRIA